MIIGHYASALLPYSKQRQKHLALFLTVAMLQDALWLSFALSGLEPVSPSSFLDGSFQNIRTEMTFSHDLVPALGWALVSFALGWLVTRRFVPALYCAALSVGHELLDLLSGFEHHIAGPHSASLGLNLYLHAPSCAILLEAAFGAAMVFAYGRSEARQGRAPSVSKLATLYAVFVLGALALLPAAETPLRAYLRS